MGRKLTIVVTCTDRKTTPSPAPHKVRNLPHGTTAARAAAWTRILAASPDRRPLRRLYQGEAWQQVGRLEAVVRAKGLTPDVVVASAGLGLRRVDSEAPAYSATFTSGHPDTVGRDRGQIRTWWRHVSRASSTEPAQTTFQGPTLLVLSAAYAAAMSDDVADLEQRDDVVMFGGAPGLLPNQRFPSDLGLRARLGGTANSINLRMATAWIERQETVDMRADATRREWVEWAAATSCLPPPAGRATVDEAGLRTWISEVVRARPTLSKTAALRLLRDSGVACEQHRFGKAFALARRPT